MSHWCRRGVRPLFPGIAIAFISLVGQTAPAIAAKHPEGKQTQERAQERAARKACLNGDYNKGTAILSDLFVATEDPTFIFNQGRCFEQNQRYEDAIGRFREYLRAGEDKLDAQDKAAAERHIADCKDMLAQERATSSPATSPASVSTPPTLPVSPEAASSPETSPPVVTQPTQPSPSPSDGSRLRTGGVVLVGLGVVATVCGVLLNVKANGMISDIKKLDGYTRESERQNYETLSWISYGVGAASLVTGAVLYGFGLSAKRRSSTSVALMPAVGVGQAGVVVSGAF